MDAGAHHRPCGGASVPSDDVQPPPVPRRRRRWVRIVTWTGVVVGALVVAVVGLGAWLYARADISNVGELSFRNALRIPELDRGQRGDDGVIRFDLEVQAGETSILPGGPTRDVGRQRRLPRPDAAGAPRRRRRDRAHQQRRRDDLDALARHAPAGAHGRRPAPTGRAGRDVAPTWSDRPARGNAVVPPAPARRDRRPRLPRRGRHVHRRRPRCRRPGPARRLRRRRHPGDRPGPARSTATTSSTTPAASSPTSVCSATRSSSTAPSIPTST